MKALLSGNVDLPAPLGIDPLEIPVPPRRLVDALIVRVALASNTYEYRRENNAVPVPDEVEKPTSIYETSTVEDRARVVAHLTEPVPERLFQDVPSLITSWTVSYGKGSYRRWNSRSSPATAPAKTWSACST